MTRRPGIAFRIATIASALAVASAGAPARASEDGGKRAADPRPRKILVLVVATDTATRASVEDVVAGELSLRGATAIASHVPFPDLPRERGPFEERLVADGFDAVTVSRMVGRADSSTYREGSDTYQPEYLGMGVWGGYWYTYHQITLPEYLSKETRVRVRTDFWRASDKEGRLVWSGTTDLFDPMTMTKAAREIGVSVAKSLSKAKLL